LINNASDTEYENEKGKRGKQFMSVPSKILHISLYVFYMSFFELELLVLYNYKCDNSTYNGSKISDDLPWIPCVNYESNTAWWMSLLISLIYLVGVPLCFTMVFIFYRKHIQTESPTVWWLEFLYFDYIPTFFYYEVLILIRKILFGLSIVFATYSIEIQLGTLLFSMACDFVLRPFRNVRSLCLQLFCYLVLLVTLMIHFFGIDNRIPTYILIVSPFVMPIIITLCDLLIAWIRTQFEEKRASTSNEPGWKYLDLHHSLDSSRQLSI
jgi:hypothetical protein